MRPFDWAELWKPGLSPFEIVFRAVVVYLAALFLFRIVGRKELARYSPFDFLLILLASQALRQTLDASDKSLTWSPVPRDAPRSGPALLVVLLPKSARCTVGGGSPEEARRGWPSHRRGAAPLTPHDRGTALAPPALWD